MFSLHVHDSLAGCNSAMLSRSLEFCVQNQCTPGSLVKSDLLSLTFLQTGFLPRLQNYWEHSALLLLWPSQLSRTCLPVQAEYSCC